MAATEQPDKELEVKRLAVDQLRLDPKNPRLAMRHGEKASQEDLLKEMYQKYVLEELLESLATHGYFTEEPLIAVPAGIDPRTHIQLYTVVEGNRRLAAVKLLLSKEVQQALGARNVPTVSPAVRSKLDPLPVKVYDKDEEVFPYLGVRHIRGVRPWEALAKAKYIERLHRSGSSIAEIRKIVSAGNRTDVIQRWLLTLYALQQANKEADIPWDEYAGDFSFSFLYTSLGYKSVRDFLGLTPKDYENPKPDPVPKRAVKNLLDHMKDLYGTPDGKVRGKVYDSRAIKYLSRVYTNSEALEALRGGASLDEAQRRTIGEAEELIDLVRQASQRLDQANSLAPHHKGNQDALRLAERAFRASEQLVKALEK